MAHWDLIAHDSFSQLIRLAEGRLGRALAPEYVEIQSIAIKYGIDLAESQYHWETCHVCLLYVITRETSSEATTYAIVRHA